MRLIFKYLLISLCMLSTTVLAEQVSENSTDSSLVNTAPSTLSDDKQVSKEKRNSEDDVKYVQYGPVKQDETLWSIATKYYEYQEGIKESSTVQQVVLATYGMNRDKFYQGNIHDLLLGSILTMPLLEQIQMVPKDLAVRKLNSDEKTSLRVAAEKATARAKDKTAVSTLPQVKIWQLVNQVGLLNSQVATLHNEVGRSDQKMDSLVQIVSSLEMSGSTNQENISKVQAELSEAKYKVKNLQVQLSQLQGKPIVHEDEELDSNDNKFDTIPTTGSQVVLKSDFKTAVITAFKQYPWLWGLIAIIALLLIILMALLICPKQRNKVIEEKNTEQTKAEETSSSVNEQSKEESIQDDSVNKTESFSDLDAIIDNEANEIELKDDSSNQVSEQSDDHQFETEDSLSAVSDEVNDDISNKLDLARAYSNMGPGEKAEAIALLNQVLKEGDDEQREQALKLLAEL